MLADLSTHSAPPGPKATGVDSAWSRLSDALSAGMDPDEFQVWLEPLVVIRDEPGRLVLTCPNAFHLSWVRDHHLGRLKTAAREIGLACDIALRVNNTPPPVNRQTPAVNSPVPGVNTSPRQLALPNLVEDRPRLNTRFRFETFVAGACNEFALAAAKALARGERYPSSTLYLVSGTGLGKSHLTQAVGHQMATGQRVAYLTAEDFANRMIAALRSKSMDAFKERFRRGCDVLLLEEVQFLAGKDKTQDELGYTLDALLDAGKRVVFTGQQPPERIKGLKPHLASRLGAGLTASIAPPDQPTRVRILEHLAGEEGVAVAPEVLECLAERIDADVRRLQAALIGLLARASLTGRPLNLALVEETVLDLRAELRRLSPAKILALVARAHGLEPAALTGKSRRQAITRPRNLALYLCRRHTDASYAELGRLFNRDHSTVMYGVDQVERALAGDQRLSQELAFMEQRLGVS
ncbi:MAG: chromosomal replication initiator protein DnaA [Pseudomonadota bacterium]